MLAVRASQHCPAPEYGGVFGAKLIRCQIKKPEQLGWAQRACDEARERGLSIVHLSHPGTLFSNVDDAIDSLKKINRPNFGLTYEPVNWMDHPKGYGPDVIKSVAPWIFNVYSQNQKVRDAGVGGGEPVDAGSALMIMTLGAGNGAQVTVASDDEAALTTVAELVQQDLDA